MEGRCGWKNLGGEICVVMIKMKRRKAAEEGGG